jgi:hypothetical protein
MAIVKCAQRNTPASLSTGETLAFGEEANVDLSNANDAQLLSEGVIVVVDGSAVPPVPAAILTSFKGFVGPWSAVLAYEPGMVTSESGSAYLATAPSVNRKPSTNAEVWTKLFEAAVLPQDASPGTPSLRSLGTGANQAAAGNDSRLSDARTPISHAASHEPGGTDPVVLTHADVGADASGAAASAQTAAESKSDVKGAAAAAQAAAESASIPLTQKDAASGVASLDSQQHLTLTQVPPSVVSGSIEPLGEVEGNVTPSLANGKRVFKMKLKGNTTVKPPINWPSASNARIYAEYEITCGVAEHTLTIEGITFPAEAPVLVLAPNAINVIQFYSDDGGITVIGAPFVKGPVGPTGATGSTGPEGKPHFVGDGSDGACVLDGATEFPFATRSGNEYSLTRDVFATTFTVNEGKTLRPGGYRVFATTSITNKGTIVYNGLAGAANGTKGAAVGQGPLAETRAGGEGATGAGSAGTNGGLGAGKAGAGGLGSSGAGGAAGTLLTEATAHYRSPQGVLTGQQWYAGGSRPVGGAPGGGGGGGDGTHKGGGGGAGGGMVVLISPTVTNTGAIEANGGNGGTPTEGNCGGGGPGGGGIILIYTTSPWTNTGTTSVVAGTKGSGVGTGAAGAAGTAGLVLNVVL